MKEEIAPKHNCKDCYGKGKLLRTAPIPNANIGFKKRKSCKEKEMVRIGTPCHCMKLRKVKEN